MSELTLQLSDLLVFTSVFFSYDGMIRTILQGEFIDASLLENFYLESENHKRLLSRMKAIQTTATARTEGGARNPMLAFAAAPTAPASPMRGEPSTASAMSTDKPQHSFELESEVGDSKPRSIVHKPLPKVILAVGAALRFMFKFPKLEDFTNSLFKRQILFHRASCALLGRYELIMGSIVLHALLALLFAWVNETITPASVIAYLGIGSLFLILANAQFIFYMFNNHHVSVYFPPYSHAIISASVKTLLGCFLSLQCGHVYFFTRYSAFLLALIIIVSVVVCVVL